jgi:regulator of replication initiation timing
MEGDNVVLRQTRDELQTQLENAKRDLRAQDERDRECMELRRLREAEIIRLIDDLERERIARHSAESANQRLLATLTRYCGCEVASPEAAADLLAGRMTVPQSEAQLSVLTRELQVLREERERDVAALQREVQRAREQCAGAERERKRYADRCEQLEGAREWRPANAECVRLRTTLQSPVPCAEAIQQCDVLRKEADELRRLVECRLEEKAELEAENKKLRMELSTRAHDGRLAALERELAGTRKEAASRLVDPWHLQTQAFTPELNSAIDAIVRCGCPPSEMPGRIYRVIRARLASYSEKCREAERVHRQFVEDVARRVGLDVVHYPQVQPGEVLDVVLRRCHDAQVELDDFRQHIASAQRTLGLTPTSDLGRIAQQAVEIADHVHRSTEIAEHLRRRLAKSVKKRTELEEELNGMKRKYA